MKKNLLIAAILLIAFNFNAQVADSIFLQPGYANQSYYNLISGEVANVDNSDWDLAFDLSAYGSSIRINGKTGTELYVYPDGDNSAWSSVDISAISSWTRSYNSDTSWYKGAFDVTANSSDPFDLGWGIYSTITHFITGDSIHIIKLSSGDYKKLQLISLSNGDYEFKYANIDGSNEVVASLSKSNFTNKNFGYYSIQNNVALDREPESDNWHLVFTKYVAELSPGTFYGVTGVLSNSNVVVAQEDQVDVSVINSPTSSYQTAINTIGYDWKSYGGGGYVLASDLCYFIKDVNDDIWKIFFSEFEGSSTGKIVFNKEALTLSNTSEMEQINSFAIYPNPSNTNNVTILYDFNASNSKGSLEIYDLNGKIVKTENLNSSGFSKKEISLNGIVPGIYFVNLTVGNNRISEKLIVQ